MEPKLGKTSARGMRNRIKSRYSQKAKPHVALVDDDELFGHLVSSTCRKLGVRLSYFPSPAEMAKSGKKSFDMLIIDYHLGETDGLKACTTLADDKPVLLISHNTRWIPEQKMWPKFVEVFVPKKMGVLRIVEEALRLHFGKQ